MGNFFNKRAAALGAVALGSVIGGSLVGASAQAQTNEFGASGFVYDLEGSDLLLEADFRGREGVRYHGRATPAPPLDGDQITPFYGGPIGCFQNSEPDGAYAVGADDRCRLAVQFINTESTEIANASIHHLETGATVEVSSLGPGEGIILRFEIVFDRVPGPYSDNFSFQATASDGTAIIDRGTMSYEVESRRATVPRNAEVTFDPASPAVRWDAPTFTGGLTIDGYHVRLVQENLDWVETNFDPEQRFTYDQVACDFADRPELTRCEVPNNQLPELPEGDGFRFAVSATTADGDGYSVYSDPFTIAAPEPEPALRPMLLNPPVPVPASPRPALASAASVDEIVTAQDYVQSLDAPILRLYQAYFNRRPDLDGAKYWLDIRRVGFAHDRIAGFMADSAEFQAAYDGTSNREYVTRVYENVLGRVSDPVGFNYWLGLLNDGRLDRAGVVQWITANAEFIENHAYIPAGDIPGPELTIADPDPDRPAYNRASFNTWNDADRDCQNARHEVLIRDSIDPVQLSASGCTVVSGRWIDPYTGAEYTDAGDVSIDHFIPLAEAHRTGAWVWDGTRKEIFGNDVSDPAALRVVGTSSNQSKGDRSPDQWLPRPEAHCDYVVSWAAQKARWDLTITQAESILIAATAARCGFAQPQTTTN